MKKLKLLFATIILAGLTSSCVSYYDDGGYYYDDNDYYESLEDVVTEFDLWYIDIHKTSGTGDIPFLSNAFTISFVNGRIYANNNMGGFGQNGTGNGLGIPVGYYDTYNGYLEMDHDIDGNFDFDVTVSSEYTIKLTDNYNNVTYYLEGYQTYEFDYDMMFYENIEYFLQEYVAWEKTYASDEGDINQFDNENFLAFTPENVTTFYSSQDVVGTDIDIINWDYVGDYFVSDVLNNDYLKILTLNYDNNDVEEFELSILSDGEIELYHYNSGTTYQFDGRGFIQFKKSSSTEKEQITGRKRIKVQRKTVERKNRK